MAKNSGNTRTISSVNAANSRTNANKDIQIKPKAESKQRIYQNITEIDRSKFSLFTNTLPQHIKDMTNAPTSRSTIKKMYSVNVLTIDTILTKKMDPMVENTAEEYGNDPVEVVNSWETVAEDGYMNIRFRTRWGNNIKHRVTLVHRTDAEDPYTVEFLHNANGDTNGQVADGMVAFRLDDCFNEGNKPIEITLKWKSYSGVKSAKFKYIPRKD